MPSKAHRSSKGRKGCLKLLKVRIIKGGNASDHANSVYGGIGEQRSLNNETNMINVNHEGFHEHEKGGSSFTLVGGEEQFELAADSDLKGGESTLADLAVPAVLLIANQAMSRRQRKSGKKSRKYRKRSFRRRR